MTENQETDPKFTHTMFYEFTDFSINTVQIKITSTEKIDDIDQLKAIAESKFIEGRKELPEDWTFIKYEVTEFKPVNPAETTICGIKLRVIDSADELKNDFESIWPDLCDQYTINNKHYYRADTSTGETLAVLESVLFGEPPSWGHFCNGIVEDCGEV